MSFSEASLLKKFKELNNTQNSIQTLSLWLIHHRKHSRSIVNSWYKEIIRTSKSERKLTFIYLANDILQNSRKKGNEYMKEFSDVLVDAIENTARYSDNKTRFTLERILNIWKDRKIYSEEVIDSYRKVLHSVKSIDTLNSPPINEGPVSPKQKSDKESQSPAKRRKTSSEDQVTKNESFTVQSALTSLLNKNPNSLREEVKKELLLNGASIQTPDIIEMINLLQELEKSASSDAVVREKIAELPSRVNDINELKNIKDKNDAMELSATVNDALNLLNNYNSRLQQELVSRKQTALQLAAFIKQQHLEAENDQKLIDEWQKRLNQVRSVKAELDVHLENLPDLTSIEEAAELIPLPSAGDLFSN